MFSNKSILARLLANENISVVQGNYETASFNVESRVLQLPLWKEMSSDVYDLLVGHEVAHALWTPRENLAVEGVPFSFVNVVEDIRIEKMVLRKYPGLVSNFSRGYLDLVNRNIFGTEGKDLNAMPFMDRLNIKAKGRQHVDIQFSEEEQPYVDMAMSVESFDDVKRVVVELANWLRQKQSEETEESGQPQSSQEQGEESIEEMIERMMGSDGEPEESEEGEAQESESGEDGEESEESESGQGEDGDESEESESGQGEEGEKTEETGEVPSEDPAPKGEEQNAKGDSPLSEVATDVAQHQNQSGLVESGTVLVHGMPREDFERRLYTYQEVLAARREAFEISEEIHSKYVEFVGESKPIVNMMVKEFEMRKAAYRNLRARNSSKGTLDVNKLHKYKYDDQLFNQVTTLADGKNHGMIMLIDYSGSMNEVLAAVIKQTINLVQFCKRVNIPFRVFAFTTDQYDENKPVPAIDRTVTRFDYSNMRLIELFSHKMSRRDYEYALESFFARTTWRWNMARFEELGSTPLNATLLATQYILEDFRKEFPTHKLNLITLTDGASDSVHCGYGEDLRHVEYPQLRDREFVMNVRGKRVVMPVRYSNQYVQGKFTNDLLAAVAGRDVKTVNYFVTASSQVWGITLRDVIGTETGYVERDIVNDMTRKVKKAVKDQGVYVNDNKEVSGYDRQFILVQQSQRGRYRRSRYQSSDITSQVEELEVPENATTNQLAKAFSKYGDSKKKSRIVTRKFAEIVA